MPSLYCIYISLSGTYFLLNSYEEQARSCFSISNSKWFGLTPEFLVLDLDGFTVVVLCSFYRQHRKYQQQQKQQFSTMRFVFLFSDQSFHAMLFKISFSMTWRSWLTNCIIFQIRKRNNELTDYRMCLSFVQFFLFNKSKNNAVLEPRTGDFRGLVAGFEAKNLSFEAKDMKMCPREAKDVLEDSTSGTCTTNKK